MPPYDGIKAVFYDLDGTLRQSDPTGRTFFADQAVNLGLPVSPEDRRRALLWEHRYFAESDELHEDRNAFPQMDAFWMNYTRRQLAALGASREAVDELVGPLHAYMSDYYRPEDVIMPGVEQTLRLLKARGCFLGVISNRETPFQDYLQTLGLGEYFDYSLAAGEIQVWKPDKAVFEHALRTTGLQAGEVVYVGDNYYADVLGARNAGIKPVLLDVEGVFAQPGCPVIHAHHQLLDVLDREDAWAEGRTEFRGA